MSTTSVSPASGKATKVAKKRVFNLDTFQKETKEAVYEVPTPITDARQLSQFEDADLLRYVNKGRERQALLDAKASIQGADASILSKVLGGFKLFPKFKIGAAGVTNRAEQEAAIMSMLRSSPAVFELVKAQIAELAEAGPEEDEEDED